MGPGCGASGDWMARIGCGNQMSGRCSGGPMGQPWELRDASSKLDRVRVDRGCEMKCRIESMPGKCCPSQTECKGAPQGK